MQIANDGNSPQDHISLDMELLIVAINYRQPISCQNQKKLR